MFYLEFNVKIMYDSHTHLNDDKLVNNWQAYLEKFAWIWGEWITTVSIDLQRAERNLKIQKDNSTKVKILWTVWLHPSLIAFGDVVLNNIEQLLQDAENFYKQNKDYVFAIWECWIDISYDDWKSLATQKKVFNMHCELAQHLDLPIVIHSRNDFKSTFQIVKNFPKLKLYFHCWGYWPDEVNIIQRNFENIWIWYAWNITYPKAENIRKSLFETNIDNVLLETDAPYLSPQVVRGQKNKPEYIKHIYDYCNNLLNKNIDEKIKQNFERLYF